jgi:DNA-binding transcriptional LysR family regulator
MPTEWFPSPSEAQALVTVLQTRNFTNAAKQLRLSPARVSELIKGLEARLGVRLVERTTRSVAPTLAGELLAARFRQTLESYREAIDSLNSLRESPLGQLRLTVAPPAADLIIAPVVQGFLRAHPGIELELSTDRHFVDIVERRFDAGVRPGRLVDKDMIAVQISDPIQFALAASPDYLRARGTPHAFGDLGQHECIRFRMPDNALAGLRFVIDDRIAAFDSSGQLTANEPNLAVRAAIDGAGLIQLPRPYLEPALAAGLLVEVMGEYAQPQVDAFHLFFPSRRQMRAPLRAFVSYMQERRQRSIRAQ